MNSPIDRSRRDMLALLGSAASLALVAPDMLAQQRSQEKFDLQEYPYTVADEPWPQFLGNHRVRLHVDQAADAVWAHIPWRRTDTSPEQKTVQVFDATGNEILNVNPLTVQDEFGDIVFEAPKSGDYFVYYLPHEKLKGARSVLGPRGQYKHPVQTAKADWKRSYANPHVLPKANVVEFQARTALDSFYPMLVSATAAEVRSLCKEYSNPVLLFTEDREHPIQMDDRLPLRWIQSGPKTSFHGVALRGEFYVLQIGVYLRSDVSSAHLPVDIHFEDLHPFAGENIPASHWTCLNTCKTDEHGDTSQQSVHVERGKVLALWCGVQIPLDIAPGDYQGSIIVLAGSERIPVQIAFHVSKDFIRATGVDQGWRLARIHWLNSTIGIDDSITHPYTPLEQKKNTIHSLDRDLVLAATGFPTSIRSCDKELLAAPITLSIDGGIPAWKSTNHTESTTSAKVVIVSRNESDRYTLSVRATIEFDGSAGFNVRLASKQTQSISDIALNISYLRESVPYAVGMGLTGGARPSSWNWTWSQQQQRWKDQGSNLDYFLWLGDVDAGLYCRLTSPSDDWRNENRGGVSLQEGRENVTFRASSGPRAVRAGEVLNFSFRLLATPVKPMDPQHWKYRYAHAYEPPEQLHALGATVNNIHQGTLPNMYINYPFLNLDLLTPYISEAHSFGMKVKIYYTMRELTTRLPELWTFRSLGDEIYRIGGTQGQGDPQLDFWLQEHLRHDYSPGWITQTSTGDIDTSLRVYSNSRLTNFYLEGLNWLVANAEIDGLYLDEIGYSRDTMQRVRRVLERRPGVMIDMHGNHDWWSCNCPIGYYMEHLPYIDRLWLGEAFDPDSPPDFWLIEMSGIPFGVSSDLLEKPNPWRGMLFGMTSRALYSGPSPTPIWKLWDEFGIEDAHMIGWWNKDVPVKTGQPDVLATVYMKENKFLVAIASWAKSEANIKLDIDWQKLGINLLTAKISMPEIGSLQSARDLRPEESIHIPIGKGCLLAIDSSKPEIGRVPASNSGIGNLAIKGRGGMF